MLSLTFKIIKNRVPFKQAHRNFTTRRSILFKEYLLLTNSLTSGGFMAAGDLIQQEFEIRGKHKSEEHDWLRLARMFVVGTILGSAHHYYYLYLDKLLPHVNIKTVFKKIALDQLIASPGTLVGFYYTMGFLEGKNIEASTQEFKSKIKYTYMGDCLYWPPVQFVNFYYLPVQYRVFYINAATMIFNIFLSYMKHYDQ